MEDPSPYRSWMRKLEGPDDPARKLPRIFLRLLPPALILLVLAILALQLARHHRARPEPEVPAWLEPLPARPLRLDPIQMAAVPIATRFDQPLGNANGALSYDAQPFRENRHLGQDWNGIGGGDSDLGDPVYAVAEGLVVYSGEPSPGWGGVIIVAHRVRSPREDGIIQSFYAHLDHRHFFPGQVVHRGQVIGTVGNAGRRYPAHLHFELRRGRSLIIGPGYAETALDRIDPEPFFQAHRGAPEDLLTPAPGLVEQPPEVIIEMQ